MADFPSKNRRKSRKRMKEGSARIRVKRERNADGKTKDLNLKSFKRLLTIANSLGNGFSKLSLAFIPETKIISGQGRSGVSRIRETTKK